MISKEQSHIMNALFTNESLANLILTKLEEESQIAEFSEINWICNKTASKQLTFLKEEYQCNLEERKAEFAEEYYTLYSEYINLVDECEQPGMFYFYITDCFEKLDELEQFCNFNDETKFEMNTLNNVLALKEELEKYEKYVIEREFSQFEIEFDD